MRVRLAVLASLLVGSACGGAEPVTFDECPITDPVGGVPEAVHYLRAVPWVREDAGWYGNDALWVSLPPDGVLPSWRTEDGALLQTKFPWWRVLSGELTIRSERVGAEENPVEGTLPSEGYGTRGFIPSSLMFTESGCWRVTAQLDAHELSLMVWACETEALPDAVSSEARSACGAT